MVLLACTVYPPELIHVFLYFGSKRIGYSTFPFQSAVRVGYGLKMYHSALLVNEMSKSCKILIESFSVFEGKRIAKMVFPKITI